MPADLGLDVPKDKAGELTSHEAAFLGGLGAQPRGAMAGGAPGGALTELGKQCREAEKVCDFLTERNVAAQIVQQLRAGMEELRRAIRKSSDEAAVEHALESGLKAMIEITDNARQALRDANVYLPLQEQVLQSLNTAASQLSERDIARVRNVLDNAFKAAKDDLPTAINLLKTAQALLEQLLQAALSQNSHARGAPEKAALLKSIHIEQRGAVAGGAQDVLMSEFGKKCRAVGLACSFLRQIRLGNQIVQVLEADVLALRQSIKKPGNDQQAVNIALEAGLKAVSETTRRAVRAQNDAKVFVALQDRLLKRRQESNVQLLSHESIQLDKLVKGALEAAQADFSRALGLIGEAQDFFEHCLQSKLGKVELVGGRLESLTGPLSALRRHRYGLVFKAEIAAAERELDRLCKALLDEQARLKGKSRESSRDSAIDQCAQRLRDSCERTLQMADLHAEMLERAGGIQTKLEAMKAAKPEGQAAVEKEWTEIDLAWKLVETSLVARNYDMAATMLDFVELECARAVTQKELLRDVQQRKDDLAKCKGLAHAPSGREADALHKMLAEAEDLARKRMQADARTLLAQISKGWRDFQDLAHRNDQAYRDIQRLRELAAKDHPGAYQQSIKLYSELTTQYGVQGLPKGHLTKLNDLQNALKAWAAGQAGEFDKLLEQWNLEYLRACEALARHPAYVKALEATRKAWRSDESLRTDPRLDEEIVKAEKCAAQADYTTALVLLDGVSRTIDAAPEVNSLLDSLVDLQADAARSIPASMAPMLFPISETIKSARLALTRFRNVPQGRSLLNDARKALAGAKARLAITGSAPRADIEQRLKTLGESPDSDKEMDALATIPGIRALKDGMQMLLGARFKLVAIDTSAMSKDDLGQIYDALASLPRGHSNEKGALLLAQNLEAMWRDLPAVPGKGVGIELPNLKPQNQLNLTSPPRPARFAAMLAAGLTLDRQLNFMFARQGDPAFGGWLRHSALDVYERFAKQLNFDHVDELRAYVERGVSPDKAKAPPTWGQAKAWVDAVRHDKKPWEQGTMCMYPVYEGGILFRDGRIYAQAGPMDWFSYQADARQWGVCGRQFRSPQDWFAYFYAAYHCGMLPEGHAALRWLKELEQDQPK